MQTINFNTNALWKRCCNRGSSVLAYKEGIVNSAWGKNQACFPEREAGEQSLERWRQEAVSLPPWEAGQVVMLGQVNTAAS